MGKDHTLFALKDGSVKFGVRRDRKVVDVLPPEIRAINAYKIKPRPLWTRLFNYFDDC